MKKLEIMRFAQASDNYAWLIIDRVDQCAALVDAVNGQDVKKYLDLHDLKLTHILNTHHHYDHVGANKYLYFDGLEVCGSRYDQQHKRIPHQTRVVQSGDLLTFGRHKVEVLDIPGHTLGHVAYILDEHVFCGDTIFLAGCGRVFEGSFEQMHSSIFKLIDSVSDDSLLYPAHEYSLSNLNFSKHLLNDSITNEAITIVNQRIADKQSSLPTKVSDEKMWNPFYRVNDPNYLKQLTLISEEAKSSAVIAFAEIRKLKDNF